MNALLLFTFFVASSDAEKLQDEYKEWIVPVTLFDSLGPPPQDLLSKNEADNFLRSSNRSSQVKQKKLPPRYSVGVLNVDASSQNTNEISMSRQHFFTFDLGNPSQTILLTEKCKGCFSSLEPESGCPKIVPKCESLFEDQISTLNTQFCWPSHPQQYLPENSYRYIIKDCPLKKGETQNAGTLDNIPICIACFDGGDHSRYYTFAETDFSFVGATQINTIESNDGTFSRHSAPASKIKHFEFGALVRTVPQRDRIWSNIGIGANSSFMQQLPAHSFLFDFDYYGVKYEHQGERIIFNPDPKLYETWAQSPYIIQHHRHHVIERFYFGSTIGNAPTNIDFFMDTGNDGISIYDTDLLEFLAYETNGSWKEDTTDPNNYGVSRLLVPYSRENAPDLSLVLSSGISVTLPGYSWVFDNGLYDLGSELNPTIFVQDEENILGLPFLTAPGYSFVFEDREKTLYISHGSDSYPSYSSIS